MSKLEPFAKQVEDHKRELIDYYLKLLTHDQRKKFYQLFKNDPIPAKQLNTAGDLIIRTLNKRDDND